MFNNVFFNLLRIFLFMFVLFIFIFRIVCYVVILLLINFGLIGWVFYSDILYVFIWDYWEKKKIFFNIEYCIMLRVSLVCKGI